MLSFLIWCVIGAVIMTALLIGFCYIFKLKSIEELIEEVDNRFDLEQPGFIVLYFISWLIWPLTLTVVILGVSGYFGLRWIFYKINQLLAYINKDR